MGDPDQQGGCICPWLRVLWELKSVIQGLLERQEGVMVAAGGLFHDMVLLILSQPPTAVDDVEKAVQQLHRTAIPLQHSKPCAHSLSKYKRPIFANLKSENEIPIRTNVAVVTLAESNSIHTGSKWIQASILSLRCRRGTEVSILPCSSGTSDPSPLRR